MTPAQIRWKALWTLGVGVLLVTLFSDPAVSVLGEVSTRLNIDSFYVSFILCPLASNASELVSSIMFAARKSQKSITMTFSALLGAATMNNTFCLAIFAALVYFKQLPWQFGPQVTAIIVVQAVVCIVACFRIQRLWLSAVPFVMYPLSLVMVKYIAA